MVSLLTAPEIARKLNIDIARVQHILATRTYIKVAARVGTVRLYAPDVVHRVYIEIKCQDTFHRDARRIKKSSTSIWDEIQKPSQ